MGSTSFSLDVAQRVYDRQGWVDAWRLEKLTYYSQAWSLGWYGKQLFDDDFQAWCDGPVEPRLYHVNKSERSQQFSTKLPGADTGRLVPEQLAIIEAVLDFYGDMSKEELIERTHAYAPWINARDGLDANAISSNIISKLEMKRFYALAELEGRDIPKRPFHSTKFSY